MRRLELSQRPVGLRLYQTRLGEVERCLELGRRRIGQLRTSAAVLMHEALGVSCASACEPSGENCAGVRIAQRHLHAAHAGPDELRILAQNAYGDVGRLGIGRYRGEERQADSCDETCLMRSHSISPFVFRLSN